MNAMRDPSSAPGLALKARRLAAGLVAGVAALVLTSCGSTAQAPSATTSSTSEGAASTSADTSQDALTVTDQDDDSIIAIQLPGNYTTGYTWSYQMDTEGVVSEQSDDYATTNTDSSVDGAGGIQTYVFKAESDGTVTITFSYARSWEDAEPDSTAIYVLTVKDGHITQDNVQSRFSDSLESQAGAQS